MRIKDIGRINALVLPENTPQDYTFQYIDISSVSSDGQISLSEPMRYDESPSRARRIVRKDDVIVSTVRTYLRAIAGIDWEAEHIIASTGFAVISPDKKFDPAYVAYLLTSTSVVDEICKESTGVSYPAITASRLSGIPIREISLHEQKLISTYLNHQLNIINKRICLRERELQTLIKLKQSEINSVITKGLNPAVPMKDSGLDLVPQIPSHWEVKRMAQIGTFSASGIDKLIIDGETPVHIINYVDVYRNETRELYNDEYMLVTAPGNKAKEHQVRVGDIIFTPSSETFDEIGIGAVVVEDIPNTAYSYHVLRFRPNVKLYLPFEKYMCNNFICTNYFSSHAAGTIRKTLSRNAFKNCPVLLPPYEEQVEIANYLDERLGNISLMVNNINEQIDKLKQLKKSLINEVISGQRPIA